MRLISLLLAVVIIGLIIYKQLGAGNLQETENTAITSPGAPTAPKVPTAPKDVPKFEQEVNDFMLDTATERDKKMREIEEK